MQSCAVRKESENTRKEGTEASRVPGATPSVPRHELRTRTEAIGRRAGLGAAVVVFALIISVFVENAFGQQLAEAGPSADDAAGDAVPEVETAVTEPVTAAGMSVAETVMVSQVTGVGSLNETASRWDVHGTDLGHMFWHRDRLYMVFGDTFGEGGLGGKNWRSNTLARLAKPDWREGLRIESMVTGPDGYAKELIPSLKVHGVETSVIPTYGISVDDRMYLHYMSVSQWGGGNGLWNVRHSGIAYSDDDGQTWRMPESAVWSAPTGFEQVAFARDGEYVYVLGIPGGRFGGLRLSRIAPDGLLDRGGYEYWTGEGWGPDIETATTVVPPPVGELSVAWNPRHERWMMMYLNLENDAVVLRTAMELTGPWSPEQVVLEANEYRGLYAPYIVPLRDLGDDVYFTLSLWNPYNVFLMHMRLQGVTDGPLAVGAGNDDSP